MEAGADSGVGTDAVGAATVGTAAAIAVAGGFAVGAAAGVAGAHAATNETIRLTKIKRFINFNMLFRTFP
jgi:hypothetical protein